MPKLPFKYLLLLCFLLYVRKLAAQTVSGFVMDENNKPLPFVNVYLKYNAEGTVTDMDGKYFLQLQNGQYTLVFSMIGYEKKEVDVIITNNNDVVKNVWLKPSSVALQQLTVKAKRKDPAYEIIRQAIKNKNKHLSQLKSVKYDLYIKAKEEVVLSEKSKQKIARKNKKRERKYKEQGIDTSFAVIPQNFKDSIKRLNINLAEILMTVYRQFPNKIKEVVKAKKVVGSPYGLFYLSTTAGDFNFYENIVEVPKLSETPIISPLSRTALFTYKYKLLKTEFNDNGTMLYTIEVKPRKKGNATVEGTLLIEDKTFALLKVDLMFKSDGLIIYNRIKIHQDYQKYNDTLYLLASQKFEYLSKAQGKLYKGTTEVLYQGYELNPEFPKKFFNAEKGVVLDSAYDYQSEYWDKQRPKPLTKEEQAYVAYKDSLFKLYNSTAYLDSVDSVYNRVTWDKILWWGQGYRKRSKHKSFWFGSIWSAWQPIYIGGMRVGPYVNYFKKFDNQTYLTTFINTTYGLRNKDLKGNVRVRYLYNPFHLGFVGVGAGRDFNFINPNDAFVNLFLRSNFIEQENISVSTSRELFNGFYTYVTTDFINRFPITGYDFGDLTDTLFGSVNEPVYFEAYKSFISEIKISYTFKQEYIKEPKRKVVLGSRYPTVSFLWRKGWNGLFSSDIDFDYIESEIKQQFKIGTLGTFSYRVASGKFVNQKDLRFIDYKFQRRGDPVLYSNPMYSYQLIPETFPSLDWYIESHFTHHFNGALVNNIPFVKKLKIFTVAGGGVLYDFASQYQYSELYVGVEKTFRFLRNRFRFGIYGVAAQSFNGSVLPPQLKISLEQFNNRENKWRF